MVNMFSQVGTLAGVWKSQPGEGQPSGAGGGMAEVTYHKTKMCVSVVDNNNVAGARTLIHSTCPYLAARISGVDPSFDFSLKLSKPCRQLKISELRIIFVYLSNCQILFEIGISTAIAMPI